MTGPEHKRDHGGGLDAAMARYGGARGDWLDLSTGINPVPYPIGDISADAWNCLPDEGATRALTEAARAFWNVPDGAEIIAAPGASALIAAMPDLAAGDEVYIPTPTYNEHAAAYSARGFHVWDDPAVPTHVYVHPNNPDGRRWPASAMGTRGLTVIDESFCDVVPEASHVAFTGRSRTVVLKSFGKFWGLAGLRLGFAIAPTGMIRTLSDRLGPWPVAGPALEIGTRALNDIGWAQTTRARLAADAARLDVLLLAHGAAIVGGTDLFRTYSVSDAAALHERLAQAHILTRIFPYSDTWVRFGLPGSEANWAQLEAAL